MHWNRDSFKRIAENLPPKQVGQKYVVWDWFSSTTELKSRKYTDVNGCTWQLFSLQSNGHKYTSFMCTTQWFNLCLHCKVITRISLVIIRHCTKLAYYWLYSSCCTLHPYDLSYDWNFVPLVPFQSIQSQATFLSLTIILFFVSMSMNFDLFVCFVF